MGERAEEDGIVRAPMNNSLRMHSRRKGSGAAVKREGRNDAPPSYITHRAVHGKRKGLCHVL